MDRSHRAQLNKWGSSEYLELFKVGMYCFMSGEFPVSRSVKHKLGTLDTSCPPGIFQVFHVNKVVNLEK